MTNNEFTATIGALENKWNTHPIANNQIAKRQQIHCQPVVANNCPDAQPTQVDKNCTAIQSALVRRNVDESILEHDGVLKLPKQRLSIKQQIAAFDHWCDKTIN